MRKGMFDFYLTSFITTQLLKLEFGVSC